MKPWMIIAAAGLVFGAWLVLWGQDWHGSGDVVASETPVQGVPIFGARQASDAKSGSDEELDSQEGPDSDDRPDLQEGQMPGVKLATSSEVDSPEGGFLAGDDTKPLDGNPEHGHMTSSEIASSTGETYAVNEDGSINVEFKLLASFQYYAPDPNLPQEKQRQNRIPDNIVALDGKLVRGDRHDRRPGIDPARVGARRSTDPCPDKPRPGDRAGPRARAWREIRGRRQGHQ